MSAFRVHDKVGELVARRPALSRVFEEAGVDHYWGGKKTVGEVCREKGFDAQLFIAKLEQSASVDGGEVFVDAADLSLTELANHIEQTHHAYLRKEFRRLDRLMEKVAFVHGENDPRLHQVRETFLRLVDALSSHMLKEEKILFPMIRQLEASGRALSFHCGSLANPIHQMELEHQEAGAALEQLRELTDGYAPPAWACDTYRALLEALAHLEGDMHQHVQKEDEVLFPRVIKLEHQLAEQEGE